MRDFQLGNNFISQTATHIDGAPMKDFILITVKPWYQMETKMLKIKRVEDLHLYKELLLDSDRKMPLTGCVSYVGSKT